MNNYTTNRTKHQQNAFVSQITLFNKLDWTWQYTTIHNTTTKSQQANYYIIFIYTKFFKKKIFQKNWGICTTQLASDYPPTTPRAKSCLKRQKTQFRQFISLNCSFKPHKRLKISQKRRETLFLAWNSRFCPKIVNCRFLTIFTTIIRIQIIYKYALIVYYYTINLLKYT